MKFDIISLYPEYFDSPFNHGIVKNAIDSGIVTINSVDVKDYAVKGHVDDYPYGGGPGMIMKPEPIVNAIRSVVSTFVDTPYVIYMSPQGSRLTAKKCREYSVLDHIVIVCGHFEGVDQRVIDHYIDEEVSIGDYVLSNGCIAAIVFIDSVIRFIPNVLGNEESANCDTFESDNGNITFDHPHYTRPSEFEGYTVPPVLKSGDHKAIAVWRAKEASKKKLIVN
jgi:tRNA (guanine37-N1)-methyltransferase